MRIVFAIGLLGLLPGSVFSAEQAAPISPRIAAPPALPVLQSYVSSFRELLQMDSEAREKVLTRKTAQQRKVIEGRLKEFDALTPDQREIRLRLMQLRWELFPLLHLAATNRSTQLAFVPEQDRALITERIKYWDQLSPDLKKLVLENETMLGYFLSGQARSTAELTNSASQLPAAVREKLEQTINRWRELTAEQRRNIYDNFRAVFGLDAKERKKIITETLLQNPSILKEEKEKIEKVTKSFEQLPRGQQERCLESFQKFNSMSIEQRAEFLRNAERWEKMSDADKGAWRDLMLRVPPLPPLPPQIYGPRPRAVAATNIDSGSAER